MNDIVRYEPTPIDTERLGDILVKSGFFKDTKDQAQAIVKMLYGGELGFGPIASMMGVYVVEGKPSMSAQLIASAIQKSGTFNYRVREWTDTVAVSNSSNVARVSGSPSSRSRMPNARS